MIAVRLINLRIEEIGEGRASRRSDLTPSIGPFGFTRSHTMNGGQQRIHLSFKTGGL